MDNFLAIDLTYYTPFFERLVLFGAVFFVVLKVSQRLLHNLVKALSAPAPGNYDDEGASERSARVGRAIADIVAYLFALGMAAEVVGIYNMVEALAAGIAFLLNFLIILVIIALGFYCFSAQGNELILSVLGYWYFQVQRQQLEQQGSFDLGQGKVGKIDRISLLHTTFRITQDDTFDQPFDQPFNSTIDSTINPTIELRPNAYLMRHFFGFSGDVIGKRS
jgi:hypothetical protein